MPDREAPELVQGPTTSTPARRGAAPNPTRSPSTFGEDRAAPRPASDPSVTFTPDRPSSIVAPRDRGPDVARPPASRATAPEWGPTDAPAIHRVAHRVGIVLESRDPADTLAFIERLAIQNGRDPRMRVAMYAEIARTVCHEATPACIRCPLGAQCQSHLQAQTERKKNRNPIRRLWTR